MSGSHRQQHQTTLDTYRPKEEVELEKIAKETLNVLPGLLLTRPDIKNDSYLYENVYFDTSRCPKLGPIKVKVVDIDAVNEAIWLNSHRPSPTKKAVAILNLADKDRPGGGFIRGKWAQEESICYRTSLSKTLYGSKHYPIPSKAVVYSPTVLIIRDSKDEGHKLVNCTDPRQLVKISVISGAAVRDPTLIDDPRLGRKTYKHNEDRELMKEKMRVVLRTALRNYHRQIVLGAFGCGVFKNPNVDVAAMWKAVLQEREFSGGWWEDVVFAIMGQKSPGSNFTVFHNELNGVQLS